MTFNLNTILYKGCVIYTYDYRVYSNHEFIGQYKTLAAAKAAATREQKRVLEEYRKESSNYSYNY